MISDVDEHFEWSPDVHHHLKAARGFRGMLWDYNPTLRRVVLRLYAAPGDERPDLYVLFSNVKSINAPADWDNSELELELENPDDEHCQGPARLFDLGNDVEIRAGHAPVCITPKGNRCYFLWGIGRNDDGVREPL